MSKVQDEITDKLIQERIQHYPGRTKVLAEVVKGEGNPYREVIGYIVTELNPRIFPKKNLRKRAEKTKQHKLNLTLKLIYLKR